MLFTDIFWKTLLKQNCRSLWVSFKNGSYVKIGCPVRKLP